MVQMIASLLVSAVLGMKLPVGDQTQSLAQAADVVTNYCDPLACDYCCYEREHLCGLGIECPDANPDFDECPYNLVGYYAGEDSYNPDQDDFGTNLSCSNAGCINPSCNFPDAFDGDFVTCSNLLELSGDDSEGAAACLEFVDPGLCPSPAFVVPV